MRMIENNKVWNRDVQEKDEVKGWHLNSADCKLKLINEHEGNFNHRSASFVMAADTGHKVLILLPTRYKSWRIAAIRRWSYCKEQDWPTERRRIIPCLTEYEKRVTTIQSGPVPKNFSHTGWKLFWSVEMYSSSIYLLRETEKELEIFPSHFNSPQKTLSILVITSTDSCSLSMYNNNLWSFRPPL